MRTLGRLAADEAVTYDKEIERLGREGKGAKFIDAKEEAAFTSVASLILTAATDAWRQSQLKAFVRASNAHIKTVIGGLKQVVDEGFLGDLLDEGGRAEALPEDHPGIERQGRDCRARGVA
jgi:hypothetical protein